MIEYSVNTKHSFQAFLNHQLLFTMHLVVILGQMFKINIFFLKNCYIWGKGIDPYKSMHAFLIVMFNYIYYIILGYLKNVANIWFQSRVFRYGSIGVSGCEISHFLAWSLINNLCKLNLILDTQPRTQRPLCVLWLFVGQRENVTEDSEDINLDRRNPAVTVVVRMPWFSKPKSKFSE